MGISDDAKQGVVPAIVPAKQGVVPREQAPTTYAPLSHPDRMGEIGRITSDAVRVAINTVCDELTKVTDDLFNVTVGLQTDARQFADDLKRLGEDQAKAIEDQTKRLQAFLDNLAKERERFFPK